MSTIDKSTETESRLMTGEKREIGNDCLMCTGFPVEVMKMFLI
jgi:hypothetical protein